MREYQSDFDKALIFKLEEDGYKLYLFDEIFKFIQNKFNPEELYYHPAFFESGSGYFVQNGIKVNIYCSCWFGIEIRLMKEEYSVEQIAKVRLWAIEIYNAIHKEEM